MEDAHLALPNFDPERKIALFGVFDGHGGRGVARFTRKYLPAAIKAQPTYQNGDYAAACAAAFEAIDRKLQTKQGRQEVRRLDRASTSELLHTAIRVRTEDVLRKTPWLHAFRKVLQGEECREDRRKLRRWLLAKQKHAAVSLSARSASSYARHDFNNYHIMAKSLGLGVKIERHFV